ncbi:MAG: hypothetical protein HOP23_02215 [Methylococcaceae bacterium]|nr:hypothetical protein [Methylococcaceae bacterium]
MTSLILVLGPYSAIRTLLFSRDNILTYQALSIPTIKNPTDFFDVLFAGNRLKAALLESRLDQKTYRLVFARQEQDVLVQLQMRAFDLIVLAFNKNILEIIKLTKSANIPNNRTPVVALLNPQEINQKIHLLDAGIEDCLIGDTFENQIIDLINDWKSKKNNTMALNYIALISDRTKHNQRLTVTIFNKLFEELPWQIKIIKEALDRQDYKLAVETVHILHGSVSLCNLEEIRKIAFFLESCLRSKNYDAVYEYFLMLETYILNFTSYRNLILANLQSTP